MINIYRKDIHTYFTTFSGYIFIAAIVLVCGIYCYMNNFYYGYASFEQSINYVPFFFVFLIPIISAGVFTDEKRQKTEQLLYTLPITSLQIVVGKYLALLTMLFVPLALVGLFPYFMSIYGDVNFKAAYCNLLIVFLLGAALCSICMFISSMTESIIVSAAVCFAVNFLIYQMSSFDDVFTKSISNSFLTLILVGIAVWLFMWYITKSVILSIIPAVAVLVSCLIIKTIAGSLLAGKISLAANSFALFSRVTLFMNGVFDLTAVVFFVSLAVLFVLFTVFTFERKRWK